MSSEGATIKSIVGDIFGFSIGDRVIYQKRMNAKVVAKVEGAEKPYGISYVTPTGDLRTIFTKANHLSYRKSKDQLEQGDKFRAHEIDVEVINKDYDDYYNEVVYFGREVEGGRVGVWSVDEVDEVLS
ncbi:MAG: hypothetical protein AWU54_1236 [Candidatus Frackibacter sp. T328-2]|nr:MAG: hypothetical protein AWU54_1236 [Candidatus Frackibacter sp. T328-2]